MTREERAAQYAAIFNNCGDNWRAYIPVDAKVRYGNTVFLDGVRIERAEDGTWRSYGGAS